jgi:hypothetical protein
VKLFKSFALEFKNIADLNVIQVQEQVFRSAVKSMKVYVDARNGGNGKSSDISIELFGDMLALPAIDSSFDTTKTCRALTKNLESFDFTDAKIDYSADGIVIAAPSNGSTKASKPDVKDAEVIDVTEVKDSDIDTKIEALTLQSDELSKQLTEVNEAIASLKERKNELVSEQVDEMSDATLAKLLAIAKSKGLV